MSKSPYQTMLLASGTDHGPWQSLLRSSTGSHLFSPYFTDYSSPSTSAISTDTGSNAGKGVSRRRDEFWVEDGRSEW